MPAASSVTERMTTVSTSLNAERSHVTEEECRLDAIFV